MDISGYMPRLIDKQIQAFLNVFGAVSIEGPKWCGKTWSSLITQIVQSLWAIRRDFQNKRLAELSPALALEGETPRLIDEWQEVPALWDAVRHLVDQRGKEGTIHFDGFLHTEAEGIFCIAGQAGSRVFQCVRCHCLSQVILQVLCHLAHLFRVNLKQRQQVM